MLFDPDCRRCPRLSAFLDEVKLERPDYHARPVAPFGDPSARLLIVGLAPGMHGANATGRPFTGDFAGILLYQTLHRFGYSSASESLSAHDGLTLKNCRVTNAVKCLPPQNKPVGSEVVNCNVFLRGELHSLPGDGVILALGGIAHNAVLKALGVRQSKYRFGHNRVHELPEDRLLIDSYHCSRYNTQTRRLTPEMFDAVFQQVESLLDRCT
ncbi:MAG: uracil-DNA glycosylase [Gammaproteobacteria bacterium]|nr:uracil-DNA glycosylase [Gammaproteobacteria bacterium]